MEIRVTKKQNVVVDGVKYKAVPTDEFDADDPCTVCHLHRKHFNNTKAACSSAPCGSPDRDDNRDVVFIRKV